MLNITDKGGNFTGKFSFTLIRARIFDGLKGPLQAFLAPNVFSLKLSLLGYFLGSFIILEPLCGPCKGLFPAVLFLFLRNNNDIQYRMQFFNILYV